MHFEIEEKFPVRSFDGLSSKLAAIGATAGRILQQTDCYYRHPARDFAQTDEAFRMRRVGDENYLTYKGPKIDADTKSRTEEEVRLSDGRQVAATCGAMLGHLGFETVAEVHKQRALYHLQRDHRRIEIALDDVEQVGAFVEIEATVEANGSEDAVIAEAKAVVASVAADLGFTQSQRRSYLQLLLERRAE